MNDKLSKCCTCGFQWRTGTHGGHSCVSRLLADIEGMKFDLAEAKADLENLVTWQPIETSPKDRSILISDGKRVVMREAWNKCDVCGKFIAFSDFDAGAIRRIIDPVDEIYETLCVEHKDA